MRKFMVVMVLFILVSIFTVGCENNQVKDYKRSTVIWDNDTKLVIPIVKHEMKVYSDINAAINWNNNDWKLEDNWER